MIRALTSSMERLKPGGQVKMVTQTVTFEVLGVQIFYFSLKQKRSYHNDNLYLHFWLYYTHICMLYILRSMYMDTDINIYIYVCVYVFGHCTACAVPCEKKSLTDRRK